jgi:hypothetical protein
MESSCRRVAVALLAVATAAACGAREAPTADRLDAAIAAYARGDDHDVEQRIDALFVRLDADVAAARADAAEAQGEARTAADARVRDLERRRRELAEAYLQARIDRFGNAAADTIRDLGRKIGEGIEDAGRRIRESLGEPTTSTRPE